jgi:hypothetical protein
MSEVIPLLRLAAKQEITCDALADRSIDLIRNRPPLREPVIL